MHDWEEERERFCRVTKDASGRRLEDHIESARLHFYSVARDAEQRTLLHVMCRWSFEPGAIETIGEILTAGGDPNATDAAERTALHVICFEEDAPPGYAQERIESSISCFDLAPKSTCKTAMAERLCSNHCSLRGSIHPSTRKARTTNLLRPT